MPKRAGVNGKRATDDADLGSRDERGLAIDKDGDVAANVGFEEIRIFFRGTLPRRCTTVQLSQQQLFTRTANSHVTNVRTCEATAPHESVARCPGPSCFDVKSSDAAR